MKKELSLLKHAKKYHDAGLSIIPVKNNKIPACGSWKEYQKEPASELEVKKWFSSPQWGIAIVCGEVSGGVVCIDIDCKNHIGKNRDDLFNEWFDSVESIIPGLMDKVVIEETPSGGVESHPNLD